MAHGNATLILILPDCQELARSIHASGRRMVVALTGGGVGALSTLLQTPGASRSVLEAVVPYSLPALIQWIGGKPDQACSEATARSMAMAAFARARQLSPETSIATLLGVGCTASLATDRPKRGERRIHAALQTAEATEVHSLPLRDETPTRVHDEESATALVLSVVARTCGVDGSACERVLPAGLASVVEHGDRARCELLSGARRLAVLKADSTSEYLLESEPLAIELVFPGAFNPLHVGHLRMAEIAEQRIGKPLAWELSITNVDKPPLDFVAIRNRMSALRAADQGRLIALTGAPVFVEKAALFPGATFVVGADTLDRIAEPRYYGGDIARRDGAIAIIGQANCRFLVFGRVIESEFVALSNLALPPELRKLCDEVPADEFREDLSSTALRQLIAGH